jgi:hypothetical protein
VWSDFYFCAGISVFGVDNTCMCQKTHFKRGVLVGVTVFFAKNLFLKKKNKIMRR